MTQHNTLNVKFSNSQFYIFPHKLLLTNTQVSKFRKAFANNFSANIKLSRN